MTAAIQQALSDKSVDGWLDVARVVFPLEDVEEVIPLYVEVPSNSSLSRLGIELTGRNSISVEKGNHVSLCTYFNAFPGALWRQYTPVRTVRLSGRMAGRAAAQLWKSSPRGRCAIYSTAVLEGDFHFDLPIDGFVDGGFYWLEFSALSDSCTLERAAWQVEASHLRVDGTLSIGITTFNRAPYCLRQLRTIAGSAELRDVIDTVYVVDQGTDLVANQPGYDDVAAELGDQLTMLRQGNLGGSGGFSRSMYEMLNAGRSEYVLLLDDDAILEPESALRALIFGNFAQRPTIVGGGMLHLDRRTILYAQGESVDYVNGRPRSDYPMNQDFEKVPLRERPEAHQMRRAEYNGWWMCLIPRQALEKVGLSLPLFLKWDDIEYGLRAERVGIPTVSLFGAAVWHLAWHDKNLLRTWEEYFSHRNTCLAILATAPAVRPVRFIWNSFSSDVLLILLFQYSSVHVRNVARREVTHGLLQLHEKLPSTVSYARSLRDGFVDSEVRKDMTDFPPVVKASNLRLLVQRKDAGSPVELAVRAGAELLRHCIARPRKSARQNPEAVVASAELSWWQLAGHDSAVVTSADGAGFTWVRRQPGLARKLLLESLRTNLSLGKRWPELRDQVRRELPEVTSPESWAETFSASQVLH